MFNSLTLRSKLIVGFAIPIVAIIVIVLAVYTSIQALLGANHWVDHTHKVIGEGKAILSSMVDMETGMRGFLVAGKDEFLEPYTAGQQSFTKTISQLKVTVSDNPAQVSRLNEIETLKESWLSEAAEPQISLRREVKQGEEASRFFNKLSARTVGKEALDGFRKELKEPIGSFFSINSLY